MPTKPQKRYALVGVAVATSVGLAIAMYFASPRSPFEKEVHARLEKSLKEHSLSFHAAELVDFGWKRVCIVNTLTSKRQLEELTAGKVPDDANTSWFLDDSYWTLAYVLENDDLILIPVRETLVADGTHECRGPDAVFRIVRPVDGQALWRPELTF